MLWGCGRRLQQESERTQRCISIIDFALIKRWKIESSASFTAARHACNKCVCALVLLSLQHGPAAFTAKCCARAWRRQAFISSVCKGQYCHCHRPPVRRMVLRLRVCSQFKAAAPKITTPSPHTHTHTHRPCQPTSSHTPPPQHRPCTSTGPLRSMLLSSSGE
jgi:hypothetical protein